jgi:hypothetical protein
MMLAGAALAQPKDIILKHLDGYFLAGRNELDRGLNFFVITKAKQFDKMFGVAKTMNNTIEYPDFKKEMVLMIALPQTNKETSIEYINAIRAGNFIEVYFKVKRSYPLTYTIQPLALAIVPEYPGVNTVKFYNGKKLVKIEKMK